MNETEMDPAGSGGGNTKLPRTLAKKWCFTHFYSDKSEMDPLIQKFDELKILYIIGLEKTKDGRNHFQGYIESPNKIRPIERLKLPKQIHWETAKGDRDSNLKYCSKEGNYFTNMKIKKPLKILDEEKLFSWQKRIIEIISQEADDRTINWFWERNGCAGKTTFAKYLAHKYGAIPLEGKKNDILYCAAEFESDIYIWDIERSMETYISYGALEKIKNGFFMCSKYESKPIIRNPPHVICFANFPPKRNELSEDRWNVVEII